MIVSDLDVIQEIYVKRFSTFHSRKVHLFIIQQQQSSINTNGNSVSNKLINL